MFCLQSFVYVRQMTQANTKFLGIIIGGSLTWNTHMSQLLPKLSKACYIMRTLKPIMSIDSLKTVNYFYFHTLITYGIIFWGNSSFSLQIFKNQKRIIRIMCGLSPRDLCRKVFKNLNILLLQSQYIYFLLLFTINNVDLCHTVSHVHGINIRHEFDLFLLQSNLMLYQNGA